VRVLLTASLLALVLVLPANAFASTSVGQLFPSNTYTVHDRSQVTGLRVNLPEPNCSTNPTDCDDIAVLNTFDGFNIQPRISIPFSGPIDVSTVSSSTVFLIGGRGDHFVGINQIAWEPGTNTLHVESDEQLAQDTTYLLVVTRGIRDTAGKRLAPLRFHQGDDLRQAILGALGPLGVAGATLFTTQSITAISAKIRSQLHSGPVDFALGTGGERTVFPLSTVTTIQVRRQVGTSTFSSSFLATPALVGVGTIAFGSFASPDYEGPDEVIPAVGTRTGTPVPQSTNTLGFTLFLPAGTAPTGGWPTAIFGHGFTDSKNGAPVAVAGSLARKGIATIAINVVGHGGGAQGTYTVSRVALPQVTLPNGGRGIDQDGNGTIDSTEGVSAVGAQALVGNRDGLRQTVIDLMQLVKDLKAGVDVDGDGTADLSTSRIYYAGQSFGGIYGVQLLGLEPDIRAGVPNVAGGPIIEIARLSPSFRGLVGFGLFSRVPSLYPVPNATFTSFVENIPLRNLPPVVDVTANQSAIQTVIDDTEWAQQAANPAAYAPFISRPVILQFARGDQTVPNPTTSAIIRAGNLAGRTTLFRNDLARPVTPGLSANPHTFLTNIVGPGAPFALAAQDQIATFFASDGATVVDPDGPGPFFETPTSMVPEDTGF
jgi:Bacterial Ig-like domain